MSSDFEIVTLDDQRQKPDVTPPVDPTYLAEINAQGRIVHDVAQYELNWGGDNKADDRTSAEVEKAEGKNPTQENSMLQRATKTQESVRPPPFPEPDVIELKVNNDESAQANINYTAPTRVLTFTEVAEQKKKEEIELSENNRKKQIEKEYAAVKERQAQDEEIVRSDREKQWKFWSTMPLQIKAVEKECENLIFKQSCAFCSKPLVQNANTYNSISENESESAAKHPWNAALAADDIDIEAINRMRTECIKKVNFLRWKTNDLLNIDPWSVLPCRHTLHGFPCALRVFQKKATDCPRCHVKIESIVPTTQLLFSADSEDVSEQRNWIESIWQCPPPLLSATNLHENAAELRPPPMPQLKSSKTNTLLTSTSSSSSLSLPEKRPAMRSRDKMDLAHERLVQKYILLDKLNVAAAADQNADDFMNVAKRLEALEPEKNLRSRLWQTLEPPTEHRPNIDRAVALTKAVAAMDDSRPLDWLAQRGFIDSDTITALSKTVNASWIASLPRSAQKTLLAQVGAFSPSIGEEWWNAIVESGLHDPASIRLLLQDKNGKTRYMSRSSLEKWANEAEKHGRYALAVELRNVAVERSNNEINI